MVGKTTPVIPAPKPVVVSRSAKDIAADLETGKNLSEEDKKDVRELASGLIKKYGRAELMKMAAGMMGKK